jgi:glycosyltransferase involved in cell wall biosynthesis
MGKFTSKFGSLSVVLVAYNEQANLRPTAIETVEFLEGRVSDPELVIVDDGSTDGTHSEAVDVAAMRPWISVLRHDRNRGMGAALKTGYARVNKEYVTFLPADGQIAPESIDALLNAAEGADLVVSSYSHREDSTVRWVLSRGLRLATWVLAGERVRSEGIYLVKRSVLGSLPLRSDTFFLNLELPIRASWARYAINETRMSARPRRSGQSKVVSVSRILGVLTDLIRLRIERLGL